MDTNWKTCGDHLVHISNHYVSTRNKYNIICQLDPNETGENIFEVVLAAETLAAIHLEFQRQLLSFRIKRRKRTQRSHFQLLYT